MDWYAMWWYAMWWHAMWWYAMFCAISHLCCTNSIFVSFIRYDANIMTHRDTKLQTSPIAWFCIGEFFGVWNITLMYSVLKSEYMCACIRVCMKSSFYEWWIGCVYIYMQDLYTYVCLRIQIYVSIYVFLIVCVCITASINDVCDKTWQSIIHLHTYSL